MSVAHRPDSGVEPCGCCFTYADAGNDFGEQLRAVAIRVDRPNRPAILLQAVDVLLDQRDDPRVERDFAAAGCKALTERLNQSVLSLLAVRIMLVRGAAPFDYACDAVGIAKAATRQPDPAAEIDALDLAVLPDAQRWPTRHRTIRRPLRTRHTRRACRLIESTSSHGNQARRRLSSANCLRSQSITSLKR